MAMPAPLTAPMSSERFSRSQRSGFFGDGALEGPVVEDWLAGDPR
jgi:hypothetical protein